MPNFFVTGLPRSGTAWMSTFLSGCPGVTCTHEALRHLQRIEDLPTALAGPGLQGTADSGLLFFLDQVEEMFPDAPWILLDRAETDSRASLQAFLGMDTPPGLYEALWAPLERIRKKALVIPFEELTERPSAERALYRIGYETRSEAGYLPWTRQWLRMKDLRVSVKKEAYVNLDPDTELVQHIRSLVWKEGA